MTKRTGLLTELEGAVLSEIHHRGQQTAFQVRRAFQTSASIEWSGSAGAVYPAIRRLTEAGLLEATAITTGRKGSRLLLTAAGLTAMETWIADATRATSVGLDPFRLRAGIWDTLAPAARDEALARLKLSVAKDLARLHEQLPTLDPVEGARVEWAILLQEMRLAWLARR